MSDIIYQSNAISQGVYSMSLYQKGLLMYGMGLMIDYYKVLLDKKKDDRITESDIVNFNETLGLTKTFPVFEFRISTFLDACGLKANQQRYKSVREGVENLVDMKIIVADEKTFKGYNWFSFAEYNENTGTIRLRFTPELSVAILNYRKAYSRLSLHIIGKLKSINACRLYEYALSFKNTAKCGVWAFSFSKDDIVQKFELHGAIVNQAANFEKRVIKTSVDDINKASNLTISYKRITRGKKIIGYDFTVESRGNNIDNKIDMSKVNILELSPVTKELVRVEKKQNPILVQREKDFEESKFEQIEIQKLIEAHSEEYIEMYNTVFEKFANFPDGMRKSFSEKEANRQILEKYKSEKTD